MKVEQWKLEDVTPYENNPRRNNDAVEYVANSIKEFGFQQPLVVDSEGVLIVGHTRLKAAELLGLETVPVVVAGDLTDDQVRAYRLADNKTAEFAEWDFSMLNEELAEIDWLDMNMSDFGFKLDDEIGGGQELYDNYSQNVGTVLYEPKETAHKISDLYSMDDDRFSDLLDEIENEELKDMLMLRKAWFCDFNFSKIADYYAYQATPQEQRAFEAMGLVLLDRDQLIENGFSKHLDMLGVEA